MKYAFVDLDGDTYVVKGKGTLEQAKTAARSNGARGALRLVRNNPGPMRKLPYNYKPKVGDVFAVVGNNEVSVVGIENGKAYLAGASMRDVPMSLATVKHFVNDLNGHIAVPKGQTFAANAKFLGKGNDGVVFKVGKLTVKASTPVPYHPENHFYATPKAAMKRLEEQWQVSEDMREAGVPGILPSKCYSVGDKSFIEKAYLTIPKKLTLKQLEKVRISVEKAHELGFVFRDQLQVGVLNGKIFHFDTGAAKASTDKFDISDDISYLRMLYTENGETYRRTASDLVYKVAAYDEVKKMAYSEFAKGRKYFSMKKGAILRDLNGLHTSDDKQFVLDFYTELTDDKDVLLTLRIADSDIMRKQGDEVVVFRAVVVKSEIL